jgi:general stress protein YciG
MNRWKSSAEITQVVKTTGPGLIRSMGAGSDDPALLKQQKRKSMAEAQHTGNRGNFAEDRAKAVRAGHVGGQHSSGNFANNRERAAEAGRKGGQASHGGSRGSEASNTRPSDNVSAAHNPGNFAEDREKASATGRKGGQSS